MVDHGATDVVLVDDAPPISLTSDKSTEAYRNWWPGPDAEMTAFMNRSIDLMERLAVDTGNRFRMNRRGYLFASADPAKVAWLTEMASKAAEHGAGPVRTHEGDAPDYRPSPPEGFDPYLTGADLLIGRRAIERHFPCLAGETIVAAHARRAGWLSAQQLGMTMLERARARGIRMAKARLTSIEQRSGRATAVVVERDGQRDTLPADTVILACGPGLPALSQSLGLGLPLFAERHLKISFADTSGAIPRNAPMLIWLDEQRLPWTQAESDELATHDETRWLTGTFPSGVHGRPDGGNDSQTVLALFNYESKPSEIVFPLPDEPHYGEVVLRGMSTMVPALASTLGHIARPFVDGGYYVKTRENRPLIGPTRIGGVYVSGAYSGFGIMASCAGGELIAAHATGRELPAYAPAFTPSRYADPAYQASLATWGDGSQL